MASFLPITTPEAVGIPSMAINAYLNNLAEHGIQMHSIMILRHGRICAQGWWKPYAPDVTHNIHSFTKTFVATSIGMLVDEGKLSIDQRIIDIFPEDVPETLDPHFETLTVRHLLSMNTGHHDDPAIRGAKNSVKAFLSTRIDHEPGTWFCYNNSASHILSLIVHKLTGQTFLEYLKPRLFDPMGFGTIDFNVSADGFPNGAGCMALTTEDMAKLAQLYLNYGEWNGKQLVSADWIRNATIPQCDNSNGTHEDGRQDWEAGYGYQLWMNDPTHTYRFDGAFGQEALICPDQDMAVICTAATCDIAGLFRLTWRFILNHCHDEALPENPHAHQQLVNRLDALALPEVKDLGTSLLQNGIDGRTITMHYPKLQPLAQTMMGRVMPGTDMHLLALTPRFADNELELQLATDQGNYVIKAGLHGKVIENEILGTPMAASAHWTDQNQLTITWRSLRAMLMTELRMTYHLQDVDLLMTNLVNGETSTGKGSLL